MNDGGIPRWVKLFLLVLAVVALLAVAVMVLGGGDHNPMRHFSLSDHPAGG